MEIEIGGLRHRLFDDFHEVLGKASAKNAPAFPQLLTAPAAGSPSEKEEKPNTTFLLLPELCGHAFSASSISRINQSLDEELKKFATRKLEEEYPYLILDARYEKVR